MYQLYERISPWRGGSADGPGPLQFDAVQSVLDAEGLRGYERECAESLLAAMDAEFRSEAARAARERMRQAKNG